MIKIFFPSSPRMPLISPKAAPFLMKEAKIMSTACSTPNRKSDLSFSETAGKSTGIPGRLQPKSGLISRKILSEVLLVKFGKFLTFPAAKCTAILDSTGNNGALDVVYDKRHETIINIDAISSFDDLQNIVVINVNDVLRSLGLVGLVGREFDLFALLEFNLSRAALERNAQPQ